MNLSEALKLISRLPQNPRGFYDELSVRFELWREHKAHISPSYQPMEWEEIILGLEKYLQTDLRKILAEPALAEIEEKVQIGIKKLSDEAVPFPLIHNGDPLLGRLCYTICRAVKPEIFVETGVAYGVTSAFLLQALKVNGGGKLYSIDRAPAQPNAEKFVGTLIPADLRDNWHLYRGRSLKILPGLLSKLKKIDIFMHDSRHTYKNMSSEFQLVAPYLAEKSILMSDDVNRNVAFQEWIEYSKPDFCATAAENTKESLFGVSLFTNKHFRTKVQKC